MHLNFMYHYEGRVGKGNPLQYSCLEIYMDGGVWGARVHGIAEWGTSEHACKKEGKNTNYDPLTPARCLHSNFRNTKMWENDQVCSWVSNEGEDKTKKKIWGMPGKSAWMSRWDWSCSLKKDRVQLETRRVHCYPEMLLLCWHYTT